MTDQKGKHGSTGAGGRTQDADDPAALAQRFADLWRENLSAMAGDPAVAAGMAESMAAWSKMTGFPTAGPAQPQTPPPVADWMALAQNWTTMMQRAAEGMGDGNTDATADRGKASPQKSGPAPDDGPSDGGSGLLHQLLGRLDELEHRLARLESDAANGGRTVADGDARSPSPAKKTRAKKSGARKGTRKTTEKRPPAKP